MLLVQLQVADHDSSLVFSMGSGLKDCSQILDASGVSALGTVLKSHLRYNELRALRTFFQTGFDTGTYVVWFSEYSGPLLS